ncbi:MAG: hypothetical protein HY541_07125, partial [Deltaproteobacteria bacterium]|nr:hypothetical protein [Deltaproteobacteria bacterium]
MTNLTLNFNLSDDEALRPWLAEFGSWQEDGGLVVDARTFQKKGANGDDYYVGGKFVVMGSISDTEKGGFEMVGAKDKTKSVCSWRESVMRFLGGLKHFVNAHSMLRRDPMSGIHGPLSEEDNFFLQTLLGHPRFQDPLDQQILHRLIRTHGPKAVLGFLDGFLGRVPGTAYENHLSRSHASAVREENGKWVLDTNLSFSAWGYRKAFLHGADVLLAAHPLVSAMLAPGEDIAVFEKIVFRGIMREQLRLVASTERPEKSQLEIRLVTTAGRRIFLAGSSNGRPVDPIVKLKNNPMALKDETGLCRRMIKEGKLDRHVDGTVSFSFPLAAVPADLQQSLLSALEHDRTGAQFLLLSTALDTVMKAMHHITLSEFSYEGMLRMVAGVADADFPSWQALTNGSLDLQLRFKTTGPSRKTENMQFLRVPIELVTRQTGKVVGSMTVIFAGTNQASIANRSLAPKSPDSSKDSGGRGIASPKGDVALHSTEDQIEEDPIDEAPVDDEAQDEPVNQAFDDFFWPLFEAGRGAGLIADDAIRFLRGQTGLSKGKQLARCLYFLNRLNRRPPGSGVGEILDDVEKFTRRLERETQVSKERGLPTIGGKIGGERGLFDKNLFEFLRTFHCGIDGEIIVADNEQSHSTYMLMLPAAGSLFEAQAVVHLLIQAGVLKDGLFRYQITLSGPLTEEAKYIALALHSHQALKSPFSPIVTSDVGFKTLAPIVDGGGAFDDIHQTGGQGVDARYDIPFLSLVSVHDGLALIAKCLESPRAKAGPLERRVLDLIDRVPAWLEKMGMIRIEGTKWPQEVADKAMSGLARVIEKEFGGQHRRAMEAATYLTWAMQGPPGSRRVEIYARFMMGMKAVYSVYRLGDVLDAQWIGKKWDEIYPGLKQVDEATETSNGFDEIVGKLVDEVVAELRILCDTGLDLPSGVSPSHTEDGVFEDEDPIGDEAPFDEAPADEITYRRVVPRWKAADTDTLAEIFARNNNDLSARNVARQVVPVAERAGLAPSQMLAVFDSIAAHIPPHEQSAAIMVLLPVAFTAAWEVELTPAQIVDLFRLIAEQSRSARAFKKLPEAIVQAWEAGFSADQIVDFIGRLTTKHGTESGDAYERFGLAVRRASDAGSSGKRIFDAMVKRFKVDIDLPPENVNLEQDVPELEKGMPHRLHYDQLKALLSSPEIMPLFFKTLWEKSHTYPLPEQPETLVLVGLKSGAWRDSVVSGL